MPWGVWLWQSSGLVWHGQRGLMVAYLGLSLGALLRQGFQVTFMPPTLGGVGERQGAWALGLGCVVCAGEEPRVEVAQTDPWWNREQVHAHLQGQSLAVSHRQVRQAAEQSGWNRLRQVLVKHYHLTAESIRPQDGWLVEQLLAQVEVLLTRLETGAGLTPEERVAVADPSASSGQTLQVLATEAGLVARPPLKALPWMMRVERVVFGQWENVSLRQAQDRLPRPAERARPLSPLSRRMLSPGFAASVPWSWPATTSVRRLSLLSVPASVSPGLWRWLRILSPTYDGRRQRVAVNHDRWYNGF